MPNIPVADIPNLPQISPAVPDTYGAQRIVRQTYGELRDQMQQRQAPMNALSAPAEALRSVGRGLADVGNATSELVQHEAQAKSDYQIAEAQNKMEAAFSAYRNSLSPAADPDQMRQGWQEKLKDVNDSIMSDPSLSPDAKQRLQIAGMRFSRISSGEIDDQARKLTFERAKDGFKTQAENLLDSGDVEGAKQVYNHMAERQLIYPEQAAQLSQFADRKHEVNQYYNQISDDPKTALQNLDSLINEKGQVLPEKSKLSVDQIGNLQQQATRAINQTRTQLMSNAMEMADNNMLASRDQIEQLGHGYFTEADIAKIDAKRMKLQPPDFETWHNVLMEATNYDSAKDTDGEQMHRILGDIHSLPDGWKEEIRSKLNQSDRTDSRLEQAYTSRINSLVQMGAFGNIEKNKDHTPVDPTGSANAFEASSNLLYNLDKYMRQNPRANPDQVDQWFKENVRQYMMIQAPDSRNWWQSHAPGWMGGKDAPGMIPAGNSSASGGSQSNQRYDQIASSFKPTASIGDDLVTVVKGMEGFRPNAYPDNKQVSVGYGTRAQSSNETLTEKEADSRLRDELGQHAARIDAAAGRYDWSLTPMQRNALISFDYSTGAGAKVLSEADDINDLKSRMAQYTKETKNGVKVESKGLLNRRKTELSMFDL